MENKTIYESIKEACCSSRLNMLDVNPTYFFGDVIAYPLPFEEGDILDYITSLTDGFMESENKMVIYNGHVSKIDICIQDIMIDTEDIECIPQAIVESYEAIVRFYYTQGNNDFIYIVSKEYDANEGITSYSLSRLLKLK